MKRIGTYLQGDFAYHALIWIILITPSVLGGTYLLRAGVDVYLLNLAWRTALVLFAVYFNYLVLIPALFQKHRYIIYFIVIVIVITLEVAGTMSCDIYMSGRTGQALKLDDMWGEVPFYFFNTCSYIVTSFLLFSLREKSEQKKRLDEVQLEKLNTEINYLRAQINPHFLFNTLNNLYGLVLEKSDKAPETILRLSKIMDYMLYESEDVMVYLKKDIENLENYVAIERIRQGNDAKIDFEVHGEVGDLKIVPLILLPLIENAFKHGVNTIIKGAYLRAHIDIGSDALILEVRNNFKEPTDPEEKRAGTGLTNLRRRLNLFYPGKHELSIDTTNDKYHAHLRLHLS